MPWRDSYVLVARHYPLSSRGCSHRSSSPNVCLFRTSGVNKAPLQISASYSSSEPCHINSSTLQLHRRTECLEDLFEMSRFSPRSSPCWSCPAVSSSRHDPSLRSRYPNGVSPTQSTLHPCPQSTSRLPSPTPYFPASHQGKYIQNDYRVAMCRIAQNPLYHPAHDPKKPKEHTHITQSENPQIAPKTHQFRDIIPLSHHTHPSQNRPAPPQQTNAHPPANPTTQTPKKKKTTRPGSTWIDLTRH